MANKDVEVPYQVNHNTTEFALPTQKQVAKRRHTPLHLLSLPISFPLFPLYLQFVPSKP